MLKRLAIENYRSCVRTSLELHPRLSVLIGPNGSGKTNILQSIMLLHRLTRQAESISNLRSRGGNSRIIAAFQEGRVLAGLRVSFDALKAGAVSDERLPTLQRWQLKERNGNRFAVEVPLAIPAASGLQWGDLRFRYMYRRYSMARLTQEPPIPKWVIRAVDNVADFCQGIKYYSASQFTNPSSCPVSFEVEESGARRKRFPFRGHLGVLHGMYAAKQSSSDGRYARFIDIVGPHGLGLIDGLTFREVRTSSTNYSVRVGGKVEIRKANKLLVIPQFKIGRLILSPNQLSEGTFKTLALLFHVMTEDSHALLIEEPEVCVHHGLLSSILELIKSYSERRQIIISTHSDYVLDHVEPENVYSVLFDKHIGTTVRHIPKSMRPKELSALKDYLAREGNLGEYWREGGLGDLS